MGRFRVRRHQVRVMRHPHLLSIVQTHAHTQSHLHLAFWAVGDSDNKGLRLQKSRACRIKHDSIDGEEKEGTLWEMSLSRMSSSRSGTGMVATPSSRAVLQTGQPARKQPKQQEKEKMIGLTFYRLFLYHRKLYMLIPSFFGPFSVCSAVWSAPAFLLPLNQLISKWSMN